jgi:integrase
MHKRITEKSIVNIKLAEHMPGGKGQYFVRDAGRGHVGHFGVKVTEKSRYFIFEATFRSAGKDKPTLKRVVLGEYPGMSVEAAIKLAEQYNTELKAGRDPLVTPQAEPVSEPGEMTLGKLIDLYMTNHCRKYLRPATIRAHELYIKYVPDAWLSQRLADVSRSDIETWHTEIGEEHGHHLANRFVEFLRLVFSYAIDRDLHMGKNPARASRSRHGRCGFVRLYDEEARERLLTSEEIQNVLAEIDAEPDWRWRACFTLLMMLGCRRGELMAARWEYVSIERGTITFPAADVKTRNSHVLPLPRLAIEILTGLPSVGASPWLFPCDRENGHVSKSGHIEGPGVAWRRIRKRAGVPDCRLHDLRHSLASRMLAEGYSLPLIGRVLNHKQAHTTMRYAHHALNDVRAALDTTVGKMFPLGLPAPKTIETPAAAVALPQSEPVA